MFLLRHHQLTRIEALATSVMSANAGPREARCNIKPSCLKKHVDLPARQSPRRFLCR